MGRNRLEASIIVDASPDSVLTAFQTIERWSTWYPGVVAASWVQGEPWQVNAVMQVLVRNSLGMLVKSKAVVLPVQKTDQDAREGLPDPSWNLAVPHAHRCCWENRALGLVTVCYAWAEATKTGSRFTLQKFYRGPLVPLVQLMKGRQQRMLNDALANLRATCA